MITCLLVYLSLFGGVYGFYLSLTRWLDTALLLALSLYLVRNCRRVPAGLWMFLAAQGVSMLVNQTAAYWSLWRLFTIAGYGGMFVITKRMRRRFSPTRIAAGIQWAGWVLFPLAVVGWATMGGRRMALFDNPNITAAFFLLLWPVGFSTLGGIKSFRGLSWGLLGMAAILATGSRGALIGVSVAALHLASVPWWATGATGIAGLIGGYLLKVGHDDSMRLNVYRQALTLFASSPFIGRGPYSILSVNPDIFHALNLPLTVAADSGLLGLAALGLNAWQMAAMRRPRWANAALLGWLAFQMVEDTFWFLSVGLVVMMLLTCED